MDEDKMRLGELLLRERVIDEDDLARCLHLQNNSPEYRHRKLGEILVSEGLLQRYKLIKYLVILGVYPVRES